MEKIIKITNDFKKEFLEYLYREEKYYTNIIELVSNYPNEVGQLYIMRKSEEITGFLHMKDDGNSIYTIFNYSDEIDLEDIVTLIKEYKSRYETLRILLGGRAEKVQEVLHGLGDYRECKSNYMFVLNKSKFETVSKNYRGTIKRVKDQEHYLEKVKSFTAEFFEAETDEEVKSVTADEKIFPKIERGMYVLENEKEVVGMARFFGMTENYGEITSVFIEKKFRGLGFGSEMILQMIEIILKMDKTPILEALEENQAAIKLYEGLGFEKIGKYAFEFI